MMLSPTYSSPPIQVPPSFSSVRPCQLSVWFHRQPLGVVGRMGLGVGVQTQEHGSQPCRDSLPYVCGIFGRYIAAVGICQRLTTVANEDEKRVQAPCSEGQQAHGMPCTTREDIYC